MFKKLGTQIVIVTMAAVAVLVAIMLVVTLLSFDSYNDSILLERSVIGLQVLENTLESKTANLEKECMLMFKDSKFKDGVARDRSAIDALYDQYHGDDPDFFLALAEQDGSIFFRSSTYPLSSFDFLAASNGKTVNGIVQADGEVVAVYINTLVVAGDNYTFCVGFRMESTDWLDEVKSMTNCDLTVFNNNTRYSTTLLDESGNRMTGTTMGDNVKATVLDQKTDYRGEVNLVGDHYYVSYTPMYDVNGNVVGALFAGSSAVDADKEFARVTWVAIGIGVVGAAIIALYIVLFCRKRVAEPLAHAEEYAREMLAGQLNSTNVNYRFAGDEVGRFVGVLQEAKQGMNAVVSDTSRVLDAMANGNFTEIPLVKYPGAFESIKNSLMKIEIDLGVTLSSMNESSTEMLTGSTQMATGSQSLAEGTTRQASAIEEISATIQDVSTQIAATAGNAAQAGELSRQTQDKVDYQDGEIVNMVNAMNEISDRSKEIEKIIKTIEDISFQTNILALNAAVEAARAGSAGKGFAVVADEVRNLATKSADAAKSTSSLITATIAAVSKGSEIAYATAESMKEVKNMSAQTADLITEIASASQDQSTSLQQITTGVDQIAQVIQTNSATAEETAALCGSLSNKSKQLKEQAARFTTR